MAKRRTTDEELLERPRSAPAHAQLEIIDRRGAHTWATFSVEGRLVARIRWEETRIDWEQYFDRQGRRHGLECEYDPFDGYLGWVAEWEHGKMHGSAIQLDPQGRPIVVSRFERGHGVDIYSSGCFGDAEVSEVRHMADGVPHGVVLWGDPTAPSAEDHYHRGKRHGIWRRWTSEGAMDSGFPEFYVNDERVTPELYATAQSVDDTLPPYRERDDLQAREMPPEVPQALRAATELAPSFDLRAYLQRFDDAVDWSP